MSTPTIPQFTRDLFPTDGCQVGVMKLSDSQKTLINKVVSGEAFINPVQGAITDAQNSLSGALNFSINTLLGTTTEIVTDPDTGITSQQTVDVFGNINPLTYTGLGGYGNNAGTGEYSGFMFYSGSVLPNSGDNYTGVGLELVGQSGSLRFSTSPSRFEVQAEAFFVGRQNIQLI